MTPPVTPRALAALALAAGLFLALPGCSGDKPAPNTGGKKPEPPTPTPTPKVDPNSNPKVDPKTVVEIPKPPEKVEKAVDDAATAFLRDLGKGEAKAAQLSGGFVKMVGLPLEPADKDRGYSVDAADLWLKRAGNGLNFFPPFEPQQAGDAAVFRGTFMGPDRNGSYALRLIKEGPAWKVDWLSLSSVDRAAAARDPMATADAVFQEFAAGAMAQLVCDKNGLPKDDRAVVLAAGMTPALRAKLGDPFASDKAQGFDYNRGTLLLEAAKIGGGAESVTVTAAGPAAFTINVIAGKTTKPYLVKLVKGTTPGQWLVESVTPQ